MAKITLGLAVHRPEMIPLIGTLMQRHHAIFLEEPPELDFERMLRGVLSIEDYLMPLDVEYPEFSRAMCRLLRKLHAAGKKIYQIEPFLEVLLGIHDFFAEGNAPDDLPKNSLEYPVYQVERMATGALLAYYQVAVEGTFEQTLAAVIRFARMDAARFRLRDSLRAQALAPIIVKYPTAYVEAGLIHLQIRQLLRQNLPQPGHVRPVFVADHALNNLNESSRLYGPGDRLTLLYIFHPNSGETGQQVLLAARAIVYSKVVAKEESLSKNGGFPHLQDELASIRAVERLSLRDCRKLFPLIRRAKTAESRQIVSNYLKETGLRTMQDRQWVTGQTGKDEEL